MFRVKQVVAFKGVGRKGCRVAREPLLEPCRNCAQHLQSPYRIFIYRVPYTRSGASCLEPQRRPSRVGAVVLSFEFLPGVKKEMGCCASAATNAASAAVQLPSSLVSPPGLNVFPESPIPLN